MVDGGLQSRKKIADRNYMRHGRKMYLSETIVIFFFNSILTHDIFLDRVLFIVNHDMA